METTAIATAIKLLESLPEPEQRQAVEYLRSYIEVIQDEAQWDELIEQTQPQLVEAAQRARRQIAEGKSKPLDVSEL
jgi:hypothetical protein